MASKWTLAQYTDGWPDQVFQDISSAVVEYGVSAGTTFTPLLPLTPERVGALRRAIVALNEEQSEYMTVQYPSARDLEIESAVDVLEKLLKEAEGATDE